MKQKMIFFLAAMTIALAACSDKNEPNSDSGSRGSSITCSVSEQTVGLTGGAFTVKIISTSAWTATADQSWVSFEPSSAQGDAFVTITVDKGIEAVANVLFSNGSGTATLTITRTDSGSGGVTPDDPTPVTPENGTLTGLFSVSATTQVQFSQGNLQYQASTNTWRFAEHQWDMVGMGYGQTDENNYCYIGGTVAGSDNRQISATYTGWIDLFGWGTGNAPTKSSTDNSDYLAFTDWGKNPIYNGGNQANQWRTLTNDEWDYLFETRANASSKYGAAKVNGVTGIVILPDVWSLPSDCGFTAGMTSASNWYDWSLVASTNTYTAAEWTKMESAGAVFLPAAGYRSGTGVFDVGSDGYYWSATPSGTDDAYRLGFYSDYLDPQDYGSRGYGRSVRLVREF